MKISPKQNTAGTNQTTQELRKRINLILKEILNRQKKQQILLLVDDLDRVRPEQAIGFLDSLFHLFLPHDHDDIESWPLSSVWAINTAVLEQALYEQYRNLPAFDPNAYIEKIFRCRVTVPPLFSSRAENSSSETLWKNEINNHPDLIKRLFSTETPNKIARKLSETTNIRAMGNLRLHKRVRQDCIRYWRKKYDPNTPHLPSPPPSLDQLAYQARLLTFTGIFPSFRDEIALFDSAWAPFINHLNARHVRLSLDPIVNPTYRQIDNSDLVTLLMDFGVISYSVEDNRYHLNREAQQRFKQNLAELVLEGF